jgi:hypothetical protein
LSDGTGYGLTGMRERAELLGGTLPAGPAALETVPRLPVQRGVIASRIPKLANLPGWPAAGS